MIRSRPVSCTYCDIINLSITTHTLGIAQKMQEDGPTVAAIMPNAKCVEPNGP